MKISISPGNVKMGAIPSVSLPACITCNPAAPCFKKCYAAKLERLRKNVKSAYARNLETLRNDPATYWLQVKAAASMTRFFRYHVSGDIPDNLKIIYSSWGAWKCDNPHGLPTSEVIFKGETPRDGWKVCGGNCAACACQGVGCWELKNGETIAFYEH